MSGNFVSQAGARVSATRLRERAAAAWSAGSWRRRVAILLGCAIAAALAGAFLFGGGHVLFGGFVKGNWRAGAFGLALAAISGALLAGEAAVVRRVLG